MKPKEIIVIAMACVCTVSCMIHSICDFAMRTSKTIIIERRKDARLMRREQRRYEKEMKKEQRRREFEHYLYGTPR